MKGVGDSSLLGRSCIAGIHSGMESKRGGSICRTGLAAYDILP